MFGLFNDPFDILSYRPKYVARVYDPFYGSYQRPQRKYDPFGIHSLNAYIQAMDHLFNNLFAYDDQEKEEEHTKEIEKKEEKSPEQNNIEQSEKIEKKEENNQSKTISTSESSKTDTKAIKPQYWSHSSVFSSHSRGGIEEIREKAFDSRTGETVESQTRRIGDRWCRIDSITDKEGLTKNKETWHNVANEEIEDFKKEWVSRRGLKKQEQIAITDKKNEKENEQKIEKNDEKIEENQNDEKREEKQNDEKIEEKE